MKCPKCGYLGYERVDRCRNCGYDFSLTSPAALEDLSMRTGAAETSPLDDLAMVDAASALGRPLSNATEVAPEIERLFSARPRETVGDLPLFGSAADEEPLIAIPRPPRPPLAVRRSTPEVPRLRSPQARTPMLDLVPPSLDPLVSASTTDDSRAATDGKAAVATLGARLVAVALDLIVLAAIDAVVVYLTMQICGLSLSDLSLLPKGPLVAFLLVQNGGYLVAFTAGGQTLGKMATGIKVISTRSDAALDLAHAVVRTLVWTALAVPAGLGFVTALFSADRRGLHDRCAGTKVVRASA